jgi:Mrp family chromosome partitioning ATPase
VADTRKFGPSRPGSSKPQSRAPAAARPPPPGPRILDSKTIIDSPEMPKAGDDSRRTAIMHAPAVAAALGVGNAPARQPTANVVRNHSPSTAPPAGEAPSILTQSVTPPTIDLVKHQLPDDGPPDRRLVLLREPDSERAAAFRILRHHLLERGRPRVVAVTSANDREGKTTTAVNLALALAECGRARVLLIDGNLRRSQLAGLFRFLPPSCFIEQLATHKAEPLAPWSFVSLAEQTLHIAAINPRSEHPHTLDGPAFASAIERLRLCDYDHIVVDCPSVVGNADVNMIQDSADGLVLVSQAKQTTARDLRHAVEQLTTAKLVGIALLR